MIILTIRTGRGKQWRNVTFKINNGCPGLVVFGDFPEDPECGYLAFDVVGLQQVDEKIQPIGVTDGKLTRLLAEVKVQDRAQGNNSCRLISTLSKLSIITNSLSVIYVQV